MITIRNIVVFVGTVAASGLAGSSAGLLPPQHHSVAKASASPLVATGNPNLGQQAQRWSGGVAQSWIGEAGPVGGVVANAYPGVINDHRVERASQARARNLKIPELKRLEYDPGMLSDLAAARLNDMLTKHYEGVISSRGQDIAEELSARHVLFSSAGILVFKGHLGDQPDNQRALDAWKNEPGTAAVLDNPFWDDFGFASRGIATSRVGEPKGYYLQVVIFRQR